MIVRRATGADIDQYLVLARQFHATCPVREVAPFDDEGFSAFYRGALQQDNIAVWCAEANGELIGVAAAMCYGLYFSPARPVVQELWWFVTPAARGTTVGRHLKHEIEAWAKTMNAAAVFMIALENDSVTAVVNLYQRNDYRPMERTFFKEVR